MATAQQLQNQINENSRAANHLLVSKGDSRWLPLDQAKFDGYMDEIERLQAMLSALPTSAQSWSPAKGAQYRQGLDAFLRRGPAHMSAAERELVRNVMSTTTPSQGGYNVPSLVSHELVSLLQGYGFMRQVAKEMTTESGADLGAATSDGTAEVGELLTQNSSAASLDPSFGTRSLNTYKFSSKIFTMPIELLQDSQVDIVSEVMQRARDRIGRAQNPYFTTGTGSSQPTGLVPSCSVGKTGTTGQTLTIIYDDLADMVDSVNSAHVDLPTAGGATPPTRRPGWMFSQTMRRVVRKVKDTAGRPIWTPSYADGATPGVPGQLLDYPVYINNDMAVPAANAKSLAFGNLNSYCIRDALAVTVFRFDDSTFTSKGQVGFLAFSRSGGNLLDTGAVKVYQHSAT